MSKGVKEFVPPQRGGEPRIERKRNVANAQYFEKHKRKLPHKKGKKK